jgi:hypothetical protein
MCTVDSLMAILFFGMMVMLPWLTVQFSTNFTVDAQILITIMAGDVSFDLKLDATEMVPSPFILILTDDTITF